MIQNNQSERKKQEEFDSGKNLDLDALIPCEHFWKEVRTRGNEARVY